MPRCLSTKLKSEPGTRAWMLSTRRWRMALMRSRMPPSSLSQSARSSGFCSTVATISLPCVGGLE